MGSSKKKPSSKNNTSTTGPAKKSAPKFAVRRKSPSHLGEDETELRTTDGHKTKSTETSQGQGAPRRPAGERSPLKVMSPEMSRVARMAASSSHDQYSHRSLGSGYHNEMQPPNPTGQMDTQSPKRPIDNAIRLDFDDTISKHRSSRSDHDEVRRGTPEPSYAQDRGPETRGKQREQSLDPVALAERIQLHQLYHSRSPVRQPLLLPRLPSEPEPIAQMQSKYPSATPGFATNAENEGDQRVMHAPGGPVSKVSNAWSDAGHERTDYTNVDPREQTRDLRMSGSECQSGDADTNDEWSYIMERGRSRAPRGTTPGQCFFNTSRREAERAYGYEAPSLHGNQHSAAPPRRDTGESISSYGCKAPYSNPSGQRERLGGLEAGVERGLYFSANPPPQYPRDDHRNADAAEVASVVNRPRAPSPRTSRDRWRRQPTPLMTTSRTAPPQPVVPDRRQIRTARSINDAREQSPSAAQTRRISNASYDRERSLSVSSFDRVSAQLSPTASARLQRREERGYMNPRSSPMPGYTGSRRRPATHRNFPQPVMSREGDPHQSFRSLGETQEPHAQYEFLRRLQPLEVDVEQRNARHVTILEEPERSPYNRDRQERNTEYDMQDWRTLIPQAHHVLDRLGEFLSPELRDGLTRLAIRAAEAPYPTDLAPRAGLEAAEYARQPDRAARSRVNQDAQTGGNRKSRPSSSKAEGGRRADHTMAVRNVLNSPDQRQTQHQEEVANNGGAERAPAPAGPSKPPGKRLPGRPRKDDPHRPEPRRKSVAPLPGEKPHVGRPKNVEIKTREQYHGGMLDYSTAVDTIKTVSKRTQFVPSSTGAHDQPSANVDQGTQATAPNPSVPQPKSAAATRHVPRAVQEITGGTQTSTQINAPQPSTEAIGTKQSNPVVEQMAPPTEDAGSDDQVVVVGVRGQFPGGTPTYIYTDAPEQVGQFPPRSATATAVGLRRSARTAIRQGSAQPVATSARPHPTPASRNIDTATSYSATRPLQRIEENVPSQTHAESRTDKLIRGESQYFASLPPSENRPPAIERPQTHHEQPTRIGRAQAHRPGSSGATLLPSQITAQRAPASPALASTARARNTQRPVYAQEVGEDVHMTENDAGTGQEERVEEGSFPEAQGIASHTEAPRPAIRSNTKRKGPSTGEAGDRGNSSSSPKKPKSERRRSPRDD